jgi:putative membrane protein
MNWQMLIILAASATPAVAYDRSTILFSMPWTFDPWVLVPLCLSCLLYWRGSRELRRVSHRDHSSRSWQDAWFWSGSGLLGLAAVSPLHSYGERLFVLHMVEHEIILVLAAPMLVGSRPLGCLLWGIPHDMRLRLVALGRTPVFATLWRALTEPVTATTLHALAVWAWHMPTLYNMALESVAMHRLQHTLFLFTALLFWWAMLNARSRRREGLAIILLFITSLHGAVLGILLTLSSTIWYPRQGGLAAEFCLTPLEDQQLAGLIMWVPAGVVYLGVAMVLAGRWITASGLQAPGELPRATSVR